MPTTKRNQQKDKAYAFLERPTNLALKIKQKMLQCEALRSCIDSPSGIRYDKDKIQSSPADKMSDIEAKIDEIERDIIKLNAAKAVAVMEINEAVEGLSDEIQKTIILEYFIGRIPMAEIGNDIGYSSSRTYELMQLGIEELGSKIP